MQAAVASASHDIGWLQTKAQRQFRYVLCGMWGLAGKADPDKPNVKALVRLVRTAQENANMQSVLQSAQKGGLSSPHSLEAVHSC